MNKDKKIITLKEEYREKWRNANYSYNRLEEISKYRMLTDRENCDYLCFIKEATVLVKIVNDLDGLLK